MYRKTYSEAIQMTRTSDITSFSDLRRNLREHLERAKQSGRPLFVTSNGQADAVVLSPEAFDALVSRADLVTSLTMLEASQSDIAAGRTDDARTALRQLANTLGVKLAG